MAQKKSSKKVVSKATKKQTSEVSKDVCKSSGHSRMSMVLVFVLLGLNVLLSLGILLSSTGSVNNAKIDSIDLKVNAIDNFFRTNVQGYDKNGSVAQVQNKQNQAAPSPTVKVSADGNPFEGDANAKVEVIEFSDYECPFCRKYWTETYPQLKADYIDTNKIKYVFRDFPLGFHSSAIPAATAANCVREQLGNSGYFKFHDIAFGEQNKQGQNTVQFTNTDILSWVKLVGGIDMAKYNICIVDPKIKAEIDADLAAGQAAGVSGTPSFFINGKMLVGAQPYSVLKAEIDAALAK